MAVATFDLAAFNALYPELTKVDATLGPLLFARAGLFLDNTGCSPVQDVTARTMLLYMVVAHLAASGPGTAAAGSAAAQGLVGRITGASEGSVSVSLDYGTQSASAAYWLQSPYGAAYWAAMAPYRLGVYVPPNRGPLGPPDDFQFRSLYGYGRARSGW